MCTMHAENLDSAVKRLTQKPMDISPAYMPLMNVILSIRRVHLVKDGERRAYRRVINVNEIADYEDYRCTFKWNPVKDDYQPLLEKSVMLASITERAGVNKKDLLTEIEKRKNMLQWMKERNIRSYKDVAAIIAEYYARPKQVYEQVLAGEEAKIVAAVRNV